MSGKECNNITSMGPRRLAAAIGWIALSASAMAETVRILPTAVVSGEVVRLGDVCDLTGVDANVHARMAEHVVATSPPPGGSVTVEASDVQAAMRKAGANLATAVLTGATRCEVTRPNTAQPKRGPEHGRHVSPKTITEAPRTLRESIRRELEKRTASFGGRLDLQFAGASDQILNLSEPEFTFDIRIAPGRSIGRAVHVEVDILNKGAKVQTVRLAASASLVRTVVVAKRPINLNATIGAEDVESAERTYENAEKLGISDIEAVIGQRAKRFVPAGTAVEPSDLEMVPLVKRGQLVDVISPVGAIEVRSVAKAAGDGGLGDVVELRIGDGRGQSVNGVVIGQRRVCIGATPVGTAASAAALAFSGRDHAN